MEKKAAPSFKTNVETRLLIQEFQKVKVGEVITYERISEVAGKEVTKLRGSIMTAIRRCLRDKDMVFACVRNVGYKRLNDDEIVDKGSSDSAALRRKALKTLEEQTKVDFEQLSRQKQMQASAQTSIMGTIAMMTKTKSIEKIASNIEAGTKELPTTQTLSLFMKG